MSAQEQMASATPEQAKAGMDAWISWAQRAGSAVVDLGAPLGNSKKLGQNTVGHGRESVVGYSVLQGNSIDQILALLKEHPHLRMSGFEIEVYEAMAMPGM